MIGRFISHNNNLPQTGIQSDKRKHGEGIHGFHSNNLHIYTTNTTIILYWLLEQNNPICTNNNTANNRANVIRHNIQYYPKEIINKKPNSTANNTLHIKRNDSTPLTLKNS